MRLPKSLLLAVALCAFSGLLIASCGDDDTPSQPEGAPPPVLEGPKVIDAVDINSDDQVARMAEGLVNATIAAAKASAATVWTVLGPTAGAEWTGDGACWSWTFQYATCTTIYKVCPIDTGFEWTVALGGTCNEVDYDDWVVLRGTTDGDGNSGTLRFYEPNTQTVNVAVAWTRTANGLSGSWAFYDGDVATANIEGTVIWSVSGTGAGEVAWERVQDVRWQLTYTQDGEAGSMEIYDWNGGAWVPWYTIVWNADGTGSWTTYDGPGDGTTQTW